MNCVIRELIWEKERGRLEPKTRTEGTQERKKKNKNNKNKKKCKYQLGNAYICIVLYFFFDKKVRSYLLGNVFFLQKLLIERSKI